MSSGVTFAVTSGPNARPDDMPAETALTAALPYVAVTDPVTGAQGTVVQHIGAKADRSHTAVADTNYTVLTTDVHVGFTALTASRVVTLCDVDTYPLGQDLVVIDEKGTCSDGITIAVQVGSDTSDSIPQTGENAIVLASPFASVRLRRKCLADRLMLKRFALAALPAVLLLTPAVGDQLLPQGWIDNSGNVKIGPLTLGRRQAGQSTLDVSGSMAAKPSDALASRLMSAWFGDERNALAYVQSGDTNFAQAINRAIVAANGRGVVRVPPGTYASPGDILINQAGRVTNGSSGGLVLDMRGVIFTGTGNLIVDSSKRVVIRGLDAKGYTLSLRGIWFSRVEDSSFDVIAFADVAGTEYSTAYWNTFDRVGASVVRFTGETNQNTFRDPILRGDAQQGWVTARAYAYEFNANVNVQALRVIGGDVSYYASGIYTIGAANTSADVDLSFSGGTYFDTGAPQTWTGRSNVKVAVRDAFLAQPKALAGTTVAAASRGEQEGWSGAVAMGWRAFADVNFIPNGDLAIAAPSYVGAGRPVSNAGGATVTVQSGGVNGRYLNINQTTTGSNIVYFASEALPVTGQYAGGIWLRSAGGTGTATVQVGINNQFVNQTYGADWTFVSFSPNAPVNAGTQVPITLNSSTGAAFNVDVMYAGVTLGDRAPLFSRSKPPAVQEGSNSFAGATVAAGAVSADIYVGGFSGLVAGKGFLFASYSALPGDCTLFPSVSAANQVATKIYCPVTARTIASGTLTVRWSPTLP